MKLEDIHYTPPTEQITAENFDRKKWIEENPVDYFKFIYHLLTTTENAPTNLPQSIKLQVVFEALYSVIRLYIPDLGR